MNKINSKTSLKITSIFAIVVLLLGVNQCAPDAEDLVVIPDKTYIKLDSSGTPLADQSVAWNFDDATASESNFDRWSCLLDEEKGIIWEIKTHDGTLRDYEWEYTWYDSDPLTNGGDHGIGDLGELMGTEYETYLPGEPMMGSDDCFDLNRCDTEKFIADVNAAGLCGASDWRLPTKAELTDLGYGASAPYIDVTYFADVKTSRDLDVLGRSDDVWSSTTYDSAVHQAYGAFFGIGVVNPSDKFNLYGIRLVRDSAP